MKKTLLFFYSTFFILHSAFSQTPSPVACYNFTGNLNEAGGGAPMTTINGSGTFTKGLSLCTWFDPIAKDSFYNWVVDQGLDLPIGNIFPKNNYTIEVLFKFTSSPYQRSWQRIIDFKNNTSDLGLYTYGSGVNYNLQMYTQYTGVTNMAGPNTWMRLFVTRDSLTGMMCGYLNDSLQISFIDNAQAGVFISDLILFKDDIVVQNEESAGTIDYVRIFDQPLTKAQISYIVNITEPTIHISGNTSLCLGDSTLLVASGATNYLWSNGATTDSIYVRDTISTFYAVTGWNYVFCTQSCKSTDTTTVNVSSCSGGPPVADFTSSDSAFCDEAGKCIDFTDHSAGSPTSWQWIFTGATPSTSALQNPTNICYYYPGTYPVTLIVYNGNGYDTLDANPLINFGIAPPPPVATAQGDTVFSTHATAYQWYFNGAPIPGATDSFYVATQSGTYAVQTTNDIGCISLSSGIYVSITSVNGLNDNGIKIYPNPAKEKITITFHKQVSDGSVKIFNAIGSEVYSFPLVQGQDKIDLDFKASAGVYFITIQLKNDFFCTKLMIESSLGNN